MYGWIETQPQLRQRHGKNKSTKDKKKKKLHTNNRFENPVSWFGQSAKRGMTRAQTDFTNALKLVVDLCNLKNKLMVLSDQWDTLRG